MDAQLLEVQRVDIIIMTEQSFVASLATDMEYSLGKDIVSHNLLGATSSTTIAMCNSRSWHGILSIYDPKHGRNKVILSTLDDSVVSGGDTYYLSVRKYPDVYFPLGYQYIVAANFNPYATIEYKLGDDALLRKEMVLAEDEATLFVRYTLVSSCRPVTVRIRPIVAYRLVDELRRATHGIYTGNTPVPNGIAYRPDNTEPPLFMQTSVPGEFVTAPDWNYNIEYPKDHREGKPYQEDLFMPGFFEVKLVSSQEFIFCASMMRQNEDKIAEKFKKVTSTLTHLSSYEQCVRYAAAHMFRADNIGFHVVENIPPSHYRSKDVCGALAGLTLPTYDYDMFRKVAHTYIDMYRKGASDDSNIVYAPETPLWFIWAIQQYTYQQNDRSQIYKDFCPSIEKIINSVINGHMKGLFVDSEGLLSLRRGSKQVYFIEINAMWYNALMFFAELCNSSRLYDKAAQISSLAWKMKRCCLERFYLEDKKYFVDSYDTDGNKDTACRPGQMPAYALPYSLADSDMISAVIPILEEKLVTPVGLRTMEADDPRYATEGSISPFYFGFLADIYIRVLGAEGVEKANGLYHSLDTSLRDVLPTCFYESFTPEPPYEGKGSPMSAVTIANINRISLLVSQF